MSDGGEPSDGGQPSAGSSAGGASGSGADAGASGAETAGAGGNEPAPGPRCTQTLYTAGDSLRDSPTTTVVLGASIEARQDVFAGAASDGGTILTQLGCTSAERSTILYDGSLETGVYTSTDVTSTLGFTWDEATFSLAPDGLTIIGRVGDTGRAFGISRRASRNVTTFDSVSTTEVANVNAWAEAHSATLRNPIFSPDGLSLFFNADVADTTESGIYEVTRDEPGDTFGEPIRLAGVVSDYAVTGVSADRLTLFGYVNWATDSFVRQTLESDFSKQTTAPIAAFRMQPLDADCQQLIGTGTPGGCQGEEVYTVTASE